MPTIRANGIETFYQDIGKHEPVLLLLHGWGNNWEAWSSLIPTLSAQYRLILPDLPGFGRSDSPSKGWTTAQYSTWLKSFLNELNIPELTAVIGHSYGGKISAFSWLTDSDLPQPHKGFFLIGPSGIPTPLSAWRRVLAKLLPIIPLSLRRGVLSPLRRFLYVTLLQEKDYLRATPFQEETLRHILPEDVREKIAQPLTTPVRFCWGEFDFEMPVWMAYPYRAISTNSHVFVVRGAGHFPHHTHPELVKQWLEAWL